ncbi:MAG: PEP-CTERM sorting domain-containing protein [Caldimonas sp.]
MRSIHATLIAAACALACSGAARADDVTFTGFAHGSQTVGFSLFAPNTAASGTVNAGGFATILNGGPSFVSYCVDLYQTITFGTLYPEYTAPGTSHVFSNGSAYGDLGKLYAEAETVDTSVEEAAFQIAVWEIAYETTGGPYSLASGTARFSGGTADSSGALALASTWLGGLGPDAGPGISVIDSRLHQDVIYAPVPEPSSVALMLAGLAATAGITRRRRSGTGRLA